MKNSFKILHRIRLNYLSLCLILMFLLTVSACKKLVQVDPPITNITGASVFNSDANAISALTGIYSDLAAYPTAGYNFTFWGALSSDELRLSPNADATSNAY